MHTRWIHIIGAWDYLKWKHVIPIKREDDENEIISAKIIVYAGENEEYYSFITHEAYHALKDWMNYRASYGERINPESWLMRNLWKTTNMKYGSKTGLAQQPEQLKNSAIKSLIGKALFQQGVRPVLEEGNEDMILKDYMVSENILKLIVNNMHK